jgi:hypothetical protein
MMSFQHSGKRNNSLWGEALFIMAKEGSLELQGDPPSLFSFPPLFLTSLAA